MKKIPHYTTDFDAVIQKLKIQTNSNDYSDGFVKFKNSSPMIFGDYFNQQTPLQLQLSPIDMNQRSQISLLSENIDFSVKDKKFDSSRLESEQKLYPPAKNFLIKEQIITEEQINTNKRFKEIRSSYLKKIELLDQKYIQQRQQILTQFQQQFQQQQHSKIIQEQPLKSALKKKDSIVSRGYKTQKTSVDDSQEDDWNLIRQAKHNLKKQKSDQNFLETEFVTPSKVRFQKKSKKALTKNDSFSLSQTDSV